MLLINYEIFLSLIWTKNCVISDGDRAVTFAIKDAVTFAIYVPAELYQVKINTKLLQKLKSEFSSTTNWNKYQEKISTERPMNI